MSSRARWLFKDEPAHYPYERLEKEGRTVWSGVRNNLALKNLRQVRKGDPILFYHSGVERRVVGIMRAASDAYPDPDGEDERWSVVDVRPERRLGRPVTLSEMKADRRFAGFDLVRMPRLSVMPVPEDVWDEIVKRGG